MKTFRETLHSLREHLTPRHREALLWFHQSTGRTVSWPVPLDDGTLLPRFGIFGYEGMKPEKVVLEFSKDIAAVVAERVWHPSQKLKRHQDGSLTMELKVVISDELRSWVAGWLEYVSVSRPPSLKRN